MRAELHRYTRWRTFSVALLATLAFCALAVSPATSSAAEVKFNCNPLSAGWWCKGTPARNFIEIGVVETYAGSVGMCVKGVRQSNESQYQGMACGYDAVAIRYTSTCNCGGLYPLHNNGANGPRNLFGYAVYP